MDRTAHVQSLEPRLLRVSVQFAVIGDYGHAGQPEADVAALVHTWSPEFVLTTGDNNYPSGAADTIDDNVGRYYHDFLYPYSGAYGPGSPTAEPRFFPTLGNHDWETPGAEPYLDYFELPNPPDDTGDERYYEFARGPVRFFALDSDPREPDGVTRNSEQARWLRRRLAAAGEPYKLVYFHHAPFSSGLHGGAADLRWPFRRWGATAVLAGHDHTYERLRVGGLTYFVNGLGGRSIYPFGDTPVRGSESRYNGDYGAMRVKADGAAIQFQFVNRAGVTVDSLSLSPRGRVIPGPPDLAGVVAGPLPAQVAGGDTGRLTLSVQNTGVSAAAGRVTVELFVSADAVLDDSDGEPLTEVTQNLRLRPGRARRVRLSFHYPVGVEGQRFLLARIDSAGAVAESDETNNVAAGPAVTISPALG